jgi:hypothetical protein
MRAAIEVKLHRAERHAHRDHAEQLDGRAREERHSGGELVVLLTQEAGDVIVDCRQRPLQALAVLFLLEALERLPDLVLHEDPDLLALVLAVDVSESVSSGRYMLQREGIARAFESPQLIEAIAAVPGGIEALVLEWSDPEKIAITVGWTRIANRGSAVAFATAVRAGKRSSSGLTAIGPALLAAAAAFDYMPDEASHKVVDVSGDGMANFGLPPGIQRQGGIIHFRPVDRNTTAFDQAPSFGLGRRKLHLRDQIGDLDLGVAVNRELGHFFGLLASLEDARKVRASGLRCFRRVKIRDDL